MSSLTNIVKRTSRVHRLVLAVFSISIFFLQESGAGRVTYIRDGISVSMHRSQPEKSAPGLFDQSTFVQNTAPNFGLKRLQFVTLHAISGMHTALTTTSISQAPAFLPASPARLIASFLSRSQQYDEAFSFFP